MHNATVQQPLTTMSPNSKLTNMMLQAEAGFASKHNVVRFRYAPFFAQSPVVFSQGSFLTTKVPSLHPLWSPNIKSVPFSPENRRKCDRIIPSQCLGVLGVTVKGLSNGQLLMKCNIYADIWIQSSLTGVFLGFQQLTFRTAIPVIWKNSKDLETIFRKF
ncbi:hypothetical protein TNCV_74191 [Trichonephila clavipes]|nr:hypothetical protein TNCV_74191 [Trichonephila clavipes]